MHETYIETYFLTATIYSWKDILESDRYKDIIIDSLRFLFENNKIKVFAFVIMPNHIHIIMHICEGSSTSSVQGSLLRFSANQMRKKLIEDDKKYLERFKVEKKDREYQFWKRNPLWIPVYSEKVFEQKLNYIHNNPVKAELVDRHEEYYYSSYRFYKEGIDEFGFLINGYEL